MKLNWARVEENRNEVKENCGELMFNATLFSFLGGGGWGHIR